MAATNDNLSKPPPSYGWATQGTTATAEQSNQLPGNMYGGADIENGFQSGSLSFSEKSIRLGFIRKVYGILLVQLLITVGFIGLFVGVENVKQYSRTHPEMWWVSFAMTFIIIIVLSCCSDFRRRWPINIILLLAFTVCEGFLLGSVASLYDADEVLIAAGICTVVCLGLTIFALQTKYDFTTCNGILFVCVLILMVFGLLAICIPSRTVSLVYSSLGALLFSCYLVVDTQMMVGGQHKYSISPEEYIFAALNLYLDIVNIFLYILSIIGNSRN